MPGPIPNRSEDLARPRERKGKDVVPVTKGNSRPATIPEMDEDWHPIAKMVWESLETSGQADFYQSSDWAIAYSVCEDLSMYKKPLKDRNGDEYHKRSGQMLQTIMGALSNLLVTEGDRRRVRIELTEPEPDHDPAALLVMNDYRNQLQTPPPTEGD
jgi:hypothetical protein